MHMDALHAVLHLCTLDISTYMRTGSNALYAVHAYMRYRAYMRNDRIRYRRAASRAYLHAYVHYRQYIRAATLTYVQQSGAQSIHCVTCVHHAT
jgi:hypothetical protein